MRVLKPEIAQNRKEKILNWVVYNYVSTGKPVSSDVIAAKGGFNISSATIRNILKELEETGYLFQTHTSGGRIPSDKGYRVYVDNISRLQKLAAAEKQRVEEEYERRVEQLDGFLKHTSKVISDLSHCAGYVISADIQEDAVKRLDLISLGSKSVLSVLFVHSGIMKHASFQLEQPLDKGAVRDLSAKLNKRLKDAPVADAALVVWKEFLQKSGGPERELLKKLVEYLGNIAKNPDQVYLEGLSRIYENMEEGDMNEMRNIARVLEEKEKFSGMLRERLRDCAGRSRALAAPGGKKHIVDVTIGSENDIKEFKNFSLVTSSYCMNDKTVGLVGILGYKRMEYPRMISIVDSVSSMVEQMLSDWDKLDLAD
ncbi:MAG: heat-inducible transcription repressor HrcA [Elusimicrobia bacterium GWA2_56_46]|nr:MAG: heat-inducible transcription repressor HrcA [Elusimicrobia bacterium GWA2_56_46]OGR54291.1 MAG: heat-inducible transcription repressor HrcA [Elusimicrobia bacterium GWC2_56_31]HBB66528.1 heat-inducible transcription repressor HrcA [Elusimicrobiota bacterium]HBW22423.1 heat-inducible transcription repressor HrcA [Elusimicrobiota bacterium]